MPPGVRPGFSGLINRLRVAVLYLKRHCSNDARLPASVFTMMPTSMYAFGPVTVCVPPARPHLRPSGRPPARPTPARTPSRTIVLLHGRNPVRPPAGPSPARTHTPHASRCQPVGLSSPVLCLPVMPCPACPHAARPPVRVPVRPCPSCRPNPINYQLHLRGCMRTKTRMSQCRRCCPRTRRPALTTPTHR